MIDNHYDNYDDVGSDGPQIGEWPPGSAGRSFHSGCTAEAGMVGVDDDDGDLGQDGQDDDGVMMLSFQMTLI